MQVVGVLGVILIGSCFGKYDAYVSIHENASIYDTFEKTESGWLFSDKIGSPGASNIERARVALGGPLGLSSNEVIYFIAITDDQGDRLNSSCSYIVSGNPIDSRWWSLTLYDTETQNYVPNEENRSSWNSAAIPRGSDGSWKIFVAASRQVNTWLPTQIEPDKQFEINLRAYNPSVQTRNSLPDIDLPVVERVSC